MPKPQRILVAVEQDDTAKFVLEKATALAQAANAQIHVVRVIYDPNVDARVHTEKDRHLLKTYLMQAEESWLEDFVEANPKPGNPIETATIWNKESYIGILDAATECEADLIIKASSQPQGINGFFRTPQDWHLLRHATIPIMLVKPEAWHSKPVVLAAIDALEDDQDKLNKAILTEASQLAKTLGGELDIVVAHPFVQPWIGPNTVPIDFERVKREIEADIHKTVERLAADAPLTYRYLLIEEGSTAVAVGHQVDTTGAEVLVMGTVARDGIKGLVIGNTSETILYHVQCDVLVLR